MKNYLIFFVLIFLTGCVKKETPCGKLNCPKGNGDVTLKTVDSDGDPVEVGYIEAYNTRTGRKYTDLQKNTYLNNTQYGNDKIFIYVLFNNSSGFSAKGDLVNVTITSKSEKKYNINLVVSGGECVCYVNKESGPDTIIID